MRTGKPLALSLAVTLLPCVCVAQTPAVPDSQTTIRATATEVHLDVVVRDKHGKQVRNLKPGDLEILEDGTPQKILSFRTVMTRDVKVETQAGEAPRASEAPRALRTVSPVCIVFHNLDPVTSRRAISIVQEFLKNELAPGTYVGLFLLDDRLKALYPFTNNRAELSKALENAFNGHLVDFNIAAEPVITANPMEATTQAILDPSGRAVDISVQVTGGEVARTVNVGADVSTSPGANIRRGEQVREQTSYRYIAGMRETDSIISMINLLGSLPGRKTVLLLTTGMVTTGDADRFQSILSSANSKNLTVYALDARGLDDKNANAQPGNIALARVASASRSQAAIGGSLSAMRERSLQMDNVQDAVRNSDVQAALRALSDGTGGFLIANTNEFRKPFQRIVEELDAHYEVAYRPESDRYDGHFRKITVKLAQSEWTAESRAGYFAMPDLKTSGALQPYEVLGLSALNAAQAPHAFDFKSAVYRFQNDASGSQTGLAFEVPGASMTATPDPEHGSAKLHLALVSLVKDASGQVVDKFNLDAPYEIPNANLPAFRAGVLTFTHPVSLPPGRYTVETAVLDREGHRTSTSVSSIESPGPRKGIDMSSAMLVQRVEPSPNPSESPDPFVFDGKRVVPLLDNRLPAGAKTYAYFQVYPDRSVAVWPRIRVEFLVGGSVLAQQTAQLPAPDASGAIPMLVQAATRAGACELRITAVQGHDSAVSKVSYNIAAP